MQRIISAPLRSVLAAGGLIAAAGVLWGCGGTDSEPTPTVQIVSPKMNDTLTGPDLFVKVATTHFQFSGAAAAKASAYGSSSSGDVTGHIHLFLDHPVGLDIDAVEQMSKTDTVTLKGLNLKAGKHYLIAEGANANHDDIEGMEDSVAFFIK
jgi:hypothetical protein